VRLEKPEDGSDRFNLIMSPLEWREVHSLVKFGQAGLAYDCKAAYVAQVFNYLFLVSRFGWLQPKDILSDKNTQAAFSEVDRLAEQFPPGGSSVDVNLKLRKEAMRQLLTVLGKAAESEEQANIVSDAFPEEFPYRYPDLEFNGDYYADIFERLLTALHEDRSS
jgi:hypothetical protein